MSGRRSGARWAGLVGLLTALSVLAGCATGAAPAAVPFKTATPPPSPTPRATATPRPIATLEPTVTAAPLRLVTPTPATAPAPAAPTLAPSATATAGQAPARQPVFSSEQAYRHVEELSIGIGTRAAGTEGEAKAADYIAEQLTAMGYTVNRQRFTVTSFVDSGSSMTVPDIQGGPIQPLAMYYSGAGQIEGTLALAGLGAPADFRNDVARGKIALVERGGGLTFQEKARYAKAGGAIAIIVYNNVEGPVQGALSDPFDLPVVSVSRIDGLRLRRLVEQRGTARVTLKVNVQTELKPSANVEAVAANLPPGLPIIIVGGHLDTVTNGPGANDNASGVGVMLELARVLSRERRAELRFVAFGAEEIGLIGSKNYVERLSGAERSRVAAMINLDMVAVGPALAIGGSDNLVAQTIALAERLGLAKVTRLTTARTASSDHLNFINAGMPAVFIHRPDDPNYHTAQDRAQFIRADSLQTVGALTLRLIEQLADKTVASRDA